ncbi:hypothetical protein Taro_054317 [Colocasia esculenta]|uniref:FERM domain-containing protein n=1 Tax=Colocasia esculenta TaxID=4460 RepID=A0A843XQU4_COLES|nr:hypothetical protein [Colocasia esculenta]
MRTVQLSLRKNWSNTRSRHWADTSYFVGKENEILKSENKTLHQRIKVLEDKFVKVENKELEEVLVDEAKRSLFSG